MDKTELESLGSYDAIVQQLNTDPQWYYEFINAWTPEWLKFSSPSYEYIVVNESWNRWDAFNKNYYWSSGLGRFQYDRSQPT